jgi:hypothetical protein
MLADRPAYGGEWAQLGVDGVEVAHFPILICSKRLVGAAIAGGGITPTAWSFSRRHGSTLYRMPGCGRLSFAMR